MSEAVASSLGIVAYLALFVGVGVLFLFVNLLVGRLLRPSDPHEEKVEIYECGEPAIGSSFVQFDLRFYVVALLFIIFDVEVAFFFPWATVFGKATNLMDRDFQVVQQAAPPELTPDAAALYRELGVRQPQVPPTVPDTLRGRFQESFGPSAEVDTPDKANFVIQQGARQLAWLTIADIGVFFGVLMVGFAYVWKRGDLNWVRAVTQARSTPTGLSAERQEAGQREPALSA